MAITAKGIFPRITKPNTKIKLISDYEKFEKRNILTKEEVKMYDKLDLSKKINKLKSENEYMFNRSKLNIGKIIKNKNASKNFLDNKLFLSGGDIVNSVNTNTISNNNLFINEINEINENEINDNFFESRNDLFYRRKNTQTKNSDLS